MAKVLDQRSKEAETIRERPKMPLAIEGKRKRIMSTRPVQARERLNLNLSKAARNEVLAMAEESQRSMTELVRLAVSVLKVVMDETKAGHKLIITTNDGKPLKELVIPR